MTSNEFPVLRQCKTLAAIILDSIFMRFIYFIFGLLCLTSINCKNKLHAKTQKYFDVFELSQFDARPTNYEIQIVFPDSFYLRDFFQQDSVKFKKRKDFYYALLTTEDILKVDSMISRIDFTKMDTSYSNGHNDGEEHYLHIEKDTLKKDIYFQNHDLPKELNNLKVWILETKNRLNFKHSDSKRFLNGFSYLIQK